MRKNVFLLIIILVFLSIPTIVSAQDLNVGAGLTLTQGTINFDYITSKVAILESKLFFSINATFDFSAVRFYFPSLNLGVGLIRSYYGNLLYGLSTEIMINIFNHTINPLEGFAIKVPLYIRIPIKSIIVYMGLESKMEFLFPYEDQGWEINQYASVIIGITFFFNEKRYTYDEEIYLYDDMGQEIAIFKKGNNNLYFIILGDNVTQLLISDNNNKDYLDDGKVLIIDKDCLESSNLFEAILYFNDGSQKRYKIKISLIHNEYWIEITEII
jgi:hypothetical protein